MFYLQQAANESAMEEELGLIGASAEDTEAELIRKICETELLAGNKNLLLFLISPHIELHLKTRPGPDFPVFTFICF